MLEQKTLKVSVVIPCYNEQGNIADCLKCLQNQTLQPYEIIVVDNNSTDDTAKIAKSLGARVVREKKQGIIAARDAGIAAARGNIIARLDADSRPSAAWIEKITETFSLNPDLQAVTGTGYFYDFPFKKASTRLRNLIAVNFGRLLLGHDMLWGSNMAIRREAWLTVRGELCSRRNIMEDLDMAMHLADEFGPASILYDPAIRVDISARRGAAGLMQNYFYITMWPKTLRGHRWAWFMAWPAACLLFAMAGPFVNTVARFYDGRTNRWTLSYEQFRRKADFDRDNP